MKLSRVFVFGVLIFSFCFSALAQQEIMISLPAPDLSSQAPLMKALENRKSTRSFKRDELSLETLSNLLWSANGINRPSTGMRTAPSAKNAQEINVYVALEKGLYLYDPIQNMLTLILQEDIRAITGIQNFTEEAPVNFIFVANLDKFSGPKEEGMFYAAADTGYISQNVYLFCAAEGLATVVLGWVDKEILAKKIGLSENQEIILTQPVGYPK